MAFALTTGAKQAVPVATVPGRPVVQPRLKIGVPNDRFERQADRVAEQVMRMSEAESSTSLPAVQRMCAECEEEKTVQAKGASGRTPEVNPKAHSEINALRGGGRPLPESVRTFFEPRFGRDFSGVRVHTGPRAASAAGQVGAQAFTVGSDVVFGEGKYAPATSVGRWLLAHELTHVVQQQGMQTPSLQRLTQAEKAENLKSLKYAGNKRLERAFDNSPVLGIGESGEAVRLVQEGLVADGFQMPASTKPSGELDGVFGAETFKIVKGFQTKHGLDVDGVVGRQTMGKLDELAQQGQDLPQCPAPEASAAFVPAEQSEDVTACTQKPLPTRIKRLLTVNIWLNAFIPKHIPGLTKPVPKQLGKTMIPGVIGGDCFLTDQRDFKPKFGVSSRMTSFISVDVSSSPAQEITQFHNCSPTHEVDCEDGSEDCTDNGDTSKMKFSNLKGSSFVTVELKGASNNPCFPGSPDIDYKSVKILIDVPARIVQAQMLIDDFPAFEMYASANADFIGTEIFREPPPKGNTPGDLFGSAARSKSGKAKLTVP